MTNLRNPSDEELGLLETLIIRANDLVLNPNWRDDLRVESMNDGAMGSLKIVPLNTSSYRKLGKTVSELEFDDADGVKVFAALNIDQNGQLFEIDIWKTDFSPLIRIPRKFP